jgi:hypothetical protein
MRCKHFLVMAMLAVLTAFTTIADATVMLFLSREDLTQRSDLVARVRVGKATVLESEDGRSLVTRTELVVTKVLKGKIDGPLVVQQLGGSFRGKTQKVRGDGQLRTGEDALVFLRRDEKGKTYLTALALSVYHVDDQGIARRYLEEMVFAKYEDGKAKRISHVEAPESVESIMTDIVRYAGGKLK